MIAHQDGDHWVVDALGAPHVERSEQELITAFVDRIAELNPQLVTFNGSSFDLPVLRYRAMVHKVSAIGLSARPYFNRYTDDAIDLCDVLSSFAPNAKASLHELCRVMGLAGKPDGMHGQLLEQDDRNTDLEFQFIAVPKNASEEQKRQRLSKFADAVMNVGTSDVICFFVWVV